MNMLLHHQGKNLELLIEFKLLIQRKMRKGLVEKKWAVEMMENYKQQQHRPTLKKNLRSTLTTR
jgi:hypothetical protein